MLPGAFFRTICSGEAHELEEGWMMPSSNMWSNSWWATRRRSGDRWQGWAYTGGDVVLAHVFDGRILETWGGQGWELLKKESAGGGHDTH